MQFTSFLTLAGFALATVFGVYAEENKQNDTPVRGPPRSQRYGRQRNSPEPCIAPYHHLGAHRDGSGDQHLHGDPRRADLDYGRALRVGDNVPHHLDGRPDEDAVQARRHQRARAPSRARLRAVMRALG